MPPHPDHHYNDKYWDDMPEVAHKAATILGYNKAKWDADEAVPYDTKTFFECTNSEKQAAMFLNLKPIEKKLNVWWEDLDQPTKDHAVALGWSEEKWDDDWEIEDLPIDKLYWAELDAKQQKAANHFGYTKATWDETWAAEDFNPAEPKKVFTAPPAGKVFGPIPSKKEHAKPPPKNDEKKEEEFKPERLIKPFKKLFGKK